MTVAARVRRPPLRSRRGRTYDRVGSSRLTAVGGLLLAVVIIGALSPPRSADPEVTAVVWATLLGLLVVGVAWPLVTVRRIGLEAEAPPDATVGERVELVVRALGRGPRCEVRGLDPTGPWHHVGLPGSGVLPHLADRRGHFDVVRIEVRVTAPLGVLSAHRVHQLVLPRAIDVAPKPLAVTWVPAPAPVPGGSNPVQSPVHGGDLVRSVRPYTPGDPAHLVHWPSSARTGALVIREMEPPVPVGQAIVVDLRDLGEEIESAASYALGSCRAVLALGGELVLSTAEPGGPVSAPVRTVRQAGRRLARAVPGLPGTPPEGWPVVEIGA